MPGRPPVPSTLCWPACLAAMHPGLRQQYSWQHSDRAASAPPACLPAYMVGTSGGASRLVLLHRTHLPGSLHGALNARPLPPPACCSKFAEGVGIQFFLPEEKFG